VGKAKRAARQTSMLRANDIASREEPMKPHSLTTYFAATTLALLSGLFIAFSQTPAHSADVPKRGVTPYVTHFIFRPVEPSIFPASAQPLFSRQAAPHRT
jgi:hypothetical protein